MPAAGDCTECSICLEGYAPTFPPLQLACGHVFHEPCIREWGKSSAYCPLCRRRIELRPGTAAAAAGAAGGVASAPVAAAVSPSAAPPAGVAVAPAVAVPRAGGAPVVTVTYVGEPPTAEAVAALLADTRRRLAGDVAAIRAEWNAFKKSDTGRVVVGVASAAASTAVAVGSSLLRDASRGIAAFLAPATSPHPVVTTSVIVPSGGVIMVPGTGGRGPTYIAPAPSSAPLPVATGGLVRCPVCTTILSPPRGAPFFRCPCGTALSAPATS